ncbi:CYTH and CHAD domain-containing protein, partial [Leucobacter sp. M11]|uniref:CYTH and CHAD domain-containing protein n=1 Tax=Leucobacter sp. M11 TaxID=2993565 RepID=UPI002D7FAB71
HPVPELRIPALTHAPGRTHELVAEYYDTADRVLARAGAAFRHRRGGSDAGWHLKERRPDGVHELRWPDAEELPAGAREELASRTGQDPAELRLEATVTMETSRATSTLRTDAGEDLIEIADDRVRATVHRDGTVRQWREWEAELLVEDVALGAVLFGRVQQQLRDAGATPAASDAKIQRALGLTSHAAWARSGTSAADLVRTALRDLADRLAAAHEELVRDDPDRVHQTRILVRRSRSLLDVFGPLLRETGGSLAPAAERLRALGRLLGEPRDAEVRLAAARARDASPEQIAALEDRHRRAHERLVAGLDAGALSDAVRALREALVRAPIPSGADEGSGAAPETEPQAAPEAAPGRADTLAGLLRLRRERLRTGAEDLLANWSLVLDTAAEAEADPETVPDAATEPAGESPWAARLHRVRKDARRVRYAVEALSRGAEPGALPAEFSPETAAEAKLVQDLLGDARDRAAFGDREGSLAALAAAHPVLSELGKA